MAILKEALQNELIDFLNRNDYNWITVLIDHSYNTINIYGVCVGLAPIKHLGDDYNEWLTDDLFSYYESDGKELQQFLDTHHFTIVNK